MKSLLSLGVLVGVVLMASLAASFPARLGRNHVADEGSWYRGVPSAGAGQQLWKQRPESTASAGEDSWDYFLFVQTSPAGDCYFENDANCAYPANSTQWTMHGIWPTQSGSLGPNYCTKVTFHLDEVEDLLPQLISQWTNVRTDTSLDSFWAHEYEKHGSCATGINAMSNEHSFFEKTLSLHQQFNFAVVLEKAGIEPSTTHNYTTAGFNKAFQSAMQVTPLLECLYSPSMEQVLYQISVCLRKDFSLMPCEKYVFDSSKTKCYEDKTFLYIPKSTH